jgi:hypothetical protein
MHTKQKYFINLVLKVTNQHCFALSSTMSLKDINVDSLILFPLITWIIWLFPNLGCLCKKIPKTQFVDIELFR